MSGNKSSSVGRVPSLYLACRLIFCSVSHFLFGRICVLPTSKELHPNHYNEMSSTRNKNRIPQTLCSFFFSFLFFKIGLFVKQVSHLVLELFSLKRQTVVANFEDRCWFVLVIK